MCGEYFTLIYRRPFAVGSPPRVRGIHIGSFGEGVYKRITPACAGNTGGKNDAKRSKQDHPRVCGEYQNPNVIHPTNSGSPPRVRGILSGNVLGASAGRITPACAGNTQYRQYPCAYCGDHPRVCGEYTKKTLDFPKFLFPMIPLFI